jgi:hypothetical protein
MSENAVSRSADAKQTGVRPRAFDTIVYGGLIVGTLDALDAVVFFGLRGSTPTGIFQYIASGLLGRPALGGGSKMTALGVLLHFTVALCIATVFYFASLAVPAMIRKPFVWGIVYGVVAYFVMNFVVVPLSAAPRLPLRLAPFINGVVGHALLIGLPLALIARRSAGTGPRAGT